MADALVTLMGILDIVAGILILFSFDFRLFSIIFASLMVLKGIMSLDFFN